MDSGLRVADGCPRPAPTKENPMKLMPHTIAAGVAALSLGLCATPALAKGGGDINNTVVSISPTAPAPVTTSGGGSGSGGSGGSNKPSKCAVVGFDPITGLVLVCTNAGA
jgi:hypothetical protein